MDDIVKRKAEKLKELKALQDKESSKKSNSVAGETVGSNKDPPTQSTDQALGKKRITSKYMNYNTVSEFDLIKDTGF